MGLLWGTANPDGQCETQYDGLFLTKQDIDRIVEERLMDNLPVKVEHAGIDVGKCVCAWNNNGKLDLLLDINEGCFEGALVSKFVDKGICSDLSLGYTVQMQFSEATKSYSMSKKYREISLVKKGAREKCHIHGWSFTDSAASAGTQSRDKVDQLLESVKPRA